MSLDPPLFETPIFLPLRSAAVLMAFCAYRMYGYTGAMLPTTTRSAPAAFAESASAPPNCPTWIWLARSAALVCAPPLIACMSTSRPRSLKMPFSNAYHMTQSSALTLLYAAMIFLQQDIATSAGVLDGITVDTVVGAGVAAGVPPPHAAARIPMTVAKVASL